ncbi:MAG: hypothetical protein V4480_00435 [Patescibacteria group bacterium]
MKKRPKQYRQEIYNFIEDRLGRLLTIDEHDELRDLIFDYVFSTRNLRAVLSRTFCRHEWEVDKKVEGGERFLLYVKCAKCDTRTSKKMPTRSVRL